MSGSPGGPAIVWREYWKEASRCMIQAPTEVRIKPPVDLALLYTHRHRLTCGMWATARSNSRGESAQLPLVNGVQPLHRRPLDDLIFQGGDAEGPLAAIWLGDVHPLDGAGVVGPAPQAV